MALVNEIVNMYIDEPVVGRMKPKLKIFLNFYGRPGIHYNASRTKDIATYVENFGKRGFDSSTCRTLITLCSKALTGQ